MVFVSVDLPILDISYKWNYITCDLLSLFFFFHDVFKARLHCNMYQDPIHVYSSLIFHCMDTLNLVIHDLL